MHCVDRPSGAGRPDDSWGERAGCKLSDEGQLG